MGLSGYAGIVGVYDRSENIIVIRDLFRLIPTPERGYQRDHIEREIEVTISDSELVVEHRGLASEPWLSASEFLDLIGALAPPVRKHRYRYFGGSGAELSVAGAADGAGGPHAIYCSAEPRIGWFAVNNAL